MTEIKSSWSFVGISPDARQAAEEAATAAGMDLDLWLAQLIKYTSAMELQQSGETPPLDQISISEAILRETSPGGRAAPADDDGREEEHMFPGVDPMPQQETEAPALQPAPRAALEPTLTGQDGQPLNVSAKALRPSGLRVLGGVSEAHIESAVEAWRRTGRMEPITVRPHAEEPGAFEIVSGLDRWHAARRAHIREVPVEIRDMADDDAVEFALTRQLQRQNLSPIDEANIFLRLMTEAGRSTEEVSRIAGKPPAHIATMVRVLSLPRSVRAMLESGEISLLHARALLGASNPDAVAREVALNGLDIYQTEQLVRSSNQNSALLDRGDLDEFDDRDEPPFAASQRHGSRPRIVARLAAATRDNQSGNRMMDSVGQKPETAEPRAGPSVDEDLPVDPEFGEEPGPGRPDLVIDADSEPLSPEELERRLAEIFGLRVSVVDNHGTGVVTLQYTERRQLIELLTRLKSREE